MESLLIFTTTNDLSLPLFLTAKVKKQMNVTIAFYFEDDEVIIDYLKNRKFDFIYLRDPFTENEINQEEINFVKKKIDLIFANKPKDVYFVDQLKSSEDVFLEDKWHQYALWSQFMPQTNLLTAEGAKDDQQYLCKRRISTRTKGLYLNCSVIKNDFSDYIIQKKLKILKEYRIYLLFGKVVDLGGIKTTKLTGGKVKLVSAEKVNPVLKEFCEKISAEINFDFVGLDVAEIGPNEYQLIEVNRSPQFNNFYKLTKLDLGESLVTELLKRKK